MTRPPAFTAAFVTIALVGAGCGGDDSDSPSESAAFPVTMENCGEEITVFQEPEQIMTVGNIAVNLLYEAGGADRIVTRAGPHDGPLGEAQAEAVSDADVVDEDDPSAETVIGADIDTVVSYGISTAEVLAESEISSYVAPTACEPAGTFEQVFDAVEELGTLLGTEDESGAAVVEMQEQIDAVAATSEGAEEQTAASVYFFGDTLTINGNQNITQAMMDTLGLTNVFADLDADFSEGNREALIDANPEVIILSYGWADGEQSFEEAKQQLRATPGLAEIRAVSEDRIVGIPSHQAQNDPAAIDGLDELAEQLERIG